MTTMNKPVTARELARRAYESSPDTLTASQEMFEMIWSDHDLRQQFEESAFRTWCQVTVQSYVSTKRDEFIAKTVPIGGTTGTTAQPSYTSSRTYTRQESTSSETIFDTPMWGGKRLGDLTKDELIAGADASDQIIANAQRKNLLARAVAAAMPKNTTQTVRECLSEAKVKKIEAEL